MNILQALRTLRPEHARLAAQQPFLSPQEALKLDRLNTVIRASAASSSERAACIRHAGLEAVRKELER